MLTTDSDVLSPETAKINAVSSYNFNEKTNPVSLGTTVAFLDNANKFTRFFEMSNVLRQGEPDIVDQSQVISQALSKNISIISNSRENSVVFLVKKVLIHFMDLDILLRVKDVYCNHGLLGK